MGVDGSASGSSPGSDSEQKSGLALESSSSTTRRATPSKDKVDKSKRKQVAETDGKGCGGLVKPDIVFFGEGLPDRFFERMSVSMPFFPPESAPKLASRCSSSAVNMCTSISCLHSSRITQRCPACKYYPHFT